MKWDFDRNIFTQIGLDSGALTILGSVVHTFPEPGIYRGSVHRPDGGQAVFYVEVDKESPAASAKIDLATLAGYTAPRLAASSGASEDECCCEGEEGQEGNYFSVNPRGYVLFHVSQGSGGYSVHVRRAQDERGGDFATNQAREGQERAKGEAAERERAGREEPVFNSQQLGEGDFFAASILRPGAYQVLNSAGRAKGALVVSYPQAGKEPYRPPEAIHVQVGRDKLDPPRLQVKPGQGVIFDIKQGPARIVVTLTQPDDGPGDTRGARPRGWSKQAPVVEGGQERARQPRQVRLPDEDES